MLLYYHYHQHSIPGFRFVETGFVGLIVLAEIAGFIGGFVCWRTPFWGPLAGAMIALVLVMALGYTLNMYLTLPKFRRFLQSDETQKFIKKLQQQNENNAT